VLSAKKKKSNKVIIFLVFWIFGVLVHQRLALDQEIIKNVGVSFGLTGQMWVGLSVILLLIIGIYWWKKDYWGISLVMVGGLINLADRIIWGYVRDYWRLGLVYNNIADWIIQIGFIIFLLELWKKK